MSFKNVCKAAHMNQLCGKDVWQSTIGLTHSGQLYSNLNNSLQRYASKTLFIQSKRTLSVCARIMYMPQQDCDETKMILKRKYNGMIYQQKHNFSKRVREHKKRERMPTKVSCVRERTSEPKQSFVERWSRSALQFEAAVCIAIFCGGVMLSIYQYHIFGAVTWIDSTKEWIQRNVETKPTNGKVTGIGSHDFGDAEKVLKKRVPPEIYYQYFAALSVLIGVVTYGVNVWLTIDVVFFNSSLYEPSPYVGIILLALIAVTNVLNCYVVWYSSSHFLNAKRNVFLRLIYGIIGLCGFTSVILLFETIIFHHFLPFPLELHSDFITAAEIEKVLKNSTKTIETIRIEHETESKAKREQERKEKDELEKKQVEKAVAASIKETVETKTGEKEEKKEQKTDETKENKEKENDTTVINLANSQQKDTKNTKKTEKKIADHSDSDDEPRITGISINTISTKPDKDSKDSDKAKDKDKEEKSEEYVPRWKREARKRAEKRMKELEKKNQEEQEKEKEAKIYRSQLQMEPIELWLEDTQDVNNLTETKANANNGESGVLVRVTSEEESRILLEGFAHNERKTTVTSAYNSYYMDYYGWDDPWGYHFGYNGTGSNKKAIPKRMPNVAASDFTVKSRVNARLRFLAAKLVTFDRSRAIEVFFESMPFVFVSLYLLCFQEMRFETDKFVNGMLWIVFGFNLLNIGNGVPRWIQANFLFTSAKSRYAAAVTEMEWLNYIRSSVCGVYFMFDIIIRLLPWILYCKIEKYQPKSYYMVPLITFGFEFLMVFMQTQYWRWFKNNVAPTKDIFSLIGNALLSLFSQYFFFSHRSWNIFCGVELLGRYIASIVLFGKYCDHNLNSKVRPTDVWGVIYICVICIHFIWGCLWSTVRYEWLQDLARHLSKEQRYVTIQHKPNVQNSATTEQVQCSLELFSTSLIPGYVPETVTILKHYRRQEEVLLRKYVESEDGRMNELARRKEQYREELERWAETEQKLQEVKLRKEKTLQEQISKGQFKSTLSKAEKDMFAKDMSLVFKKKLEKRNGKNGMITIGKDDEKIGWKTKNTINVKKKDKELIEMKENKEEMETKDDEKSDVLNLKVGASIEVNERDEKEDTLMVSNANGAIIEEEEETNISTNNNNKNNIEEKKDEKENAIEIEKERESEAKTMNEIDDNKNDATIEEEQEIKNERNNGDITDAKEEKKSEYNVPKVEKVDSLGALIQDAIEKQASGVVEENAPKETTGTFVD